MRNTFLLKAFLLVCVLFLSSAYAVETVKLDPSAQAQTLEGWGTSLCWWAHRVGQWPSEKTAPILRALTDPNQLNMNIFRYNIGGGDDPTHRGGHMARGKGVRAEMEGFRPSANAPYNWKADRGQRRILLELKALRPDAIFEAFANSPPYWMTISGCSAGNQNPHKDNLAPENIPAFCTYLIDVCLAYQKIYGVTFRTLEPFNESQTAYWRALGDQEGCHFDLKTQIQVIRELAPRLKASGLPTTISVADENCLAHCIQGINSYEKAGDIWGSISQLNTHSYSGNNAQRAIIAQKVQKLGKRFWQSETGPIGIPGGGLVNNLLLTQRLFDDMRIMRPVAWLDWQAMEEWNDVWCLFCYTYSNQQWRPVKNFYVRMQITRFFKQGYHLLQTDHPQVLAAISPDKKELVFSILNATPHPRVFQTHILPPFKIGTWQTYRTSAKENCQPLSLPSCTAYSAPAHSLTTFIVRRKGQ